MDKRIMFITASMIRGGAERVISILANDYAKRGWKVSIVMTLHSFVGYELDSSIDVVDISDDSKSPVLRMPYLILKLRSLMRKSEPDAVVSFMDNVCLLSGMAHVGLSSRFITSERIDPSQIHRSRIMGAVINWIYSNSDCCVLQTQRAFNYFPEKVQRKASIIPNPIKVGTYATCSSKRIVTSGRLSKQKNHAMLIDAFSELHADFPDWRLDIYGEGPLRGDLEDRISRKGLCDFISLKGNVSDLHRQIADAGMFVLSSDYEGLSNALLEAMMMGLPCISTNCAGSDEAIESGKNGFIIPVGDKDALKKAMATLMCNRKKALEMGKAAAISARRYDADTVINQWRSIIEVKK